MAHVVKRGKVRVQCSKTKRLAQKAAARLRAKTGSKKVRIVKVSSCAKR